MGIRLSKPKRKPEPAPPEPVPSRPPPGATNQEIEDFYLKPPPKSKEEDDDEVMDELTLERYRVVASNRRGEWNPKEVDAPRLRQRPTPLDGEWP